MPSPTQELSDPTKTPDHPSFLATLSKLLLAMTSSHHERGEVNLAPLIHRMVTVRRFWPRGEIRQLLQADLVPSK